MRNPSNAWVIELANFNQYLKIERGLASASIAAYCSDIKQLAQAMPSSLPQISPQHLSSYLAKLKQNRLSLRSLARKISALKLFFGFLLKEKKITQDPSALLETPHFHQPLPEVLTFEEICQIIAHASSPKNRLAFQLLFASGLRISELTQILVSDLDLELGLLRVRGKGQKIRVVPIDAQTNQMLKEYLAEHKTSQFLFETPKQKPFTRQGFWKSLKQAVIKAGISKNVSPHSFRHSYASCLIVNGMNLRTLQLLLGHSDLATTEIYSHLAKEHLHQTLKQHHPRSKKN